MASVKTTDAVRVWAHHFEVSRMEGAAVHNRDESQAMSIEQLNRLVYELLDAHVDTICLGERLGDDLEWAAHLEYLRGLQRVSRELMAGVGAMA
jgi:hypothetical protein